MKTEFEDVLNQFEADLLITGVEHEIERLRSVNDDGDLDDAIDQALQLLRKLRVCNVLTFQD